jgi:hypothetical protein
MQWWELELVNLLIIVKLLLILSILFSVLSEPATISWYLLCTNYTCIWKACTCGHIHINNIYKACHWKDKYTIPTFKKP